MIERQPHVFDLLRLEAGAAVAAEDHTAVAARLLDDFDLGGDALTTGGGAAGYAGCPPRLSVVS